MYPSAFFIVFLCLFFPNGDFPFLRSLGMMMITSLHNPSPPPKTKNQNKHHPSQRQARVRSLGHQPGHGPPRAARALPAPLRARGSVCLFVCLFVVYIYMCVCVSVSVARPLAAPLRPRGSVFSILLWGGIIPCVAIDRGGPPNISRLT